jgi:hypothetical protein
MLHTELAMDIGRKGRYQVIQEIYVSPQRYFVKAAMHLAFGRIVTFSITGSRGR